MNGDDAIQQYFTRSAEDVNEDPAIDEVGTLLEHTKSYACRRNHTGLNQFCDIKLVHSKALLPRWAFEWFRACSL